MNKIIERPCRICGNLFSTNSYRKIFCSDECRLESHLEATPSGCLIWKASSNPDGYGWMRYEGTIELSHRVAWQIKNGPIPDGLFVLHSCDNPPCCNPQHLFLGTHLDNMKDMWAKGRKISPKTTLTEEVVSEIRQLGRQGNLDLRELGKRFGIHKDHAGRIMRRVVWKHVL